MFLLDTNICIYFMKNLYPHLTEKILSYDPSALMISSVTVFELSYGAEKSNWGERNKQKLAMFLAPFKILPFTADDAVTAGKIRCYLEKLGTPIGPYDLQIAAQGLTRNLTLVTHNTGEFKRVPNLKLENWIK
ncbi:MAG: type II toxin-antitoxin system VapC family toxin [Acidaminococcaceae bacterium]|nr:type II toxin-antitoxin system VapC family toxin [Acidaminococcaceae bacterium]